MHFSIILAICSVIGGIAASENEPIPYEYGLKQVVCPVYTKSVYESQNIQFDVNTFDVGNLCTILVVFDKYWHEAKDPWATEDSQRDSDYSQLTGLQKKYPKLKVLLGIRRNNQDYINIARNDASRQEYAKNVADFVAKYGFHGADLRWHYSSTGLNSGVNSDLFLNLLKQLKEKFHETNLLLTSSYIVGKGSDINEKHFPALAESSDFVAIFHSYMTYDNYMDANKARDLAYIEEYFGDILSNINMNDKNKILIGLPFQSPEFVLNPKSFLNRMVDFNTVCDLITLPDKSDLSKTLLRSDLAYTLRYDAQTKINSEIVFECSRSVANKMRFAVGLGMGGAMISGLHHDDIAGKCGFETYTWKDFEDVMTAIRTRTDKTRTFTLLRTINEAIEVIWKELQPIPTTGNSQGNAPANKQQNTTTNNNNKPSHSARNSICVSALIGGIAIYLLL